MERRKRILVTALDWGLGHAARCVPLISELLAHECEVLLASNGAALALLNKEFPALKSFELPGYDPVYPSDGSMIRKMAFQLPKFINTIRAEQQQTETIVEQNQIDVVISDNRYGCYSHKVKSIFLTHQLNILMPDGWGLLQKIISHFNRVQIKKFSECWVPDFEGDKGLAGVLSVNNYGLKARYIGPISRFKRQSATIKYDLLILASGPEPQKGNFIKLLDEQVHQLHQPLKCAWVYGNASAGQMIIEENDHEIRYNYLIFNELNVLIQQSQIIVSRSGYRTVMDLAKLEKKAIFIPTPGQTEQEYLATELMKKQVAFTEVQSKFNLEKVLKESEKFTGFLNFEQDDSLLRDAVQSIL